MPGRIRYTFCLKGTCSLGIVIWIKVFSERYWDCEADCGFGDSMWKPWKTNEQPPREEIAEKTKEEEFQEDRWWLIETAIKRSSRKRMNEYMFVLFCP